MTLFRLGWGYFGGVPVFRFHLRGLVRKLHKYIGSPAKLCRQAVPQSPLKGANTWQVSAIQP